MKKSEPVFRNNVKEKLFISLAWLPKATVQAALGPVALGKAREALADHIMAQANNLRSEVYQALSSFSRAVTCPVMMKCWSRVNH